MADTIVSIQEVSKTFGPVKAVDRISLDVPPRMFLTLLGPSGCGKTTLLRIIAGFEEPTSGRVFIGGEDFTYVPAHRRPVNMVFQRYALFPHLNVFDNVAFGLRVKNTDESIIRERVQRTLDLIQLSEFGSRQVHQLSGGQAQRVALARALVNEPKVLLLDEPLGALDLKIRQQMQLELKLLHAELGTTFIYVTHDQEEAMAMSDVIAVMRDGRIVQTGSPEQIYSQPASEFVADFIGHSNIISADVESTDPIQLRILGQPVTITTESPAGIPLKEGIQVKVLIRPESLHPIHGDGGAAFDNLVTGQVIDTTYKGAFVTYLVAVEGWELQVQQAGREGTHLFRRGDSVQIGWNDDEVTILPS